MRNVKRGCTCTWNSLRIRHCWRRTWLIMNRTGTSISYPVLVHKAVMYWGLPPKDVTRGNHDLLAVTGELHLI